MCEIDWKIVPNWIQAISSLGAIVSIVFLWRTLKAQNKTLVEQQKLTDLEYRRYFESIMPILDIIKKDELGLTIHVSRNTLFDFCIVNDPVKKYLNYDDSIINHPVGSNIDFTFDLNSMRENNDLPKVVEMSFKDRLNNRYRQSIILGVDEIKLDQPKLYSQGVGLSIEKINYTT